MTTLTKQQQTDVDFMREALKLAHNAALANEVPVGALVVSDGQIIGQAYNQTITACDPSAHAEVLAVRNAGATCIQPPISSVDIVCDIGNRA